MSIIDSSLYQETNRISRVSQLYCPLPLDNENKTEEVHSSDSTKRNEPFTGDTDNLSECSQSKLLAEHLHIDNTDNFSVYSQNFLLAEGSHIQQQNLPASPYPQKLVGDSRLSQAIDNSHNLVGLPVSAIPSPYVTRPGSVASIYFQERLGGQNPVTQENTDNFLNQEASQTIKINFPNFNQEQSFKVKIYLIKLEELVFPSDLEILKKFKSITNFNCWNFELKPLTKWEKFRKSCGAEISVKTERRGFSVEKRRLKRRVTMGNAPIQPRGVYQGQGDHYGNHGHNDPNHYRQGTSMGGLQMSHDHQNHTQSFQRNNSLSHRLNNNAQNSYDPNGEFQDLGLIDSNREGGNSRPWSQNVYFKLFLDPEGIKASLLVVKCELTYVNLFTNQQHSLYKCRFIGGKNEGEQWVFDLMKSQWEPTVPSTDAAEVNYLVTMNFAPSKSTCNCLKSLIQLQKALLRGLNFQGHVKVTIRFSHPTNWRDPETQKALKNLFNSGVSFQVLTAEDILEEMRVDGLDDNAKFVGNFTANNIYSQQGQVAVRNNPQDPSNGNNKNLDDIKRFYVDKRLTWQAPNLSTAHTNLKDSAVILINGKGSPEDGQEDDNNNESATSTALEKTGPRDDIMFDEAQQDYIRQKFPPEVVSWFLGVINQRKEFLSEQNRHITIFFRLINQSLTPCISYYSTTPGIKLQHRKISTRNG